ncbi:hypothetical protein [Novipirellula artificiosorum]|uniref:Uncharacterized protein n=1 Tax=Novipirellula artificiosorum TaxID=2528016 RepID=A0A5C6E3K1_9BACT|nr:hypothetical protein [Novipirellula artificiosorum]TWU41779.1 hypothetical protein Poly41_00710 [Novipirellula artificiosorum]
MADLEPETQPSEAAGEAPADANATKTGSDKASELESAQIEVTERKLTLSDIKALPEDVDEDGFVSIWNVASTTCAKDTAQARELAAKMLCFLCKKKCDFVVTSTNNAQYLDEWFERDTKILYDWKPESELVDVVSQHAEVPYEAFLSFLSNQKFSPDSKYTATRAARVEWFQQMWCVG